MRLSLLQAVCLFLLVLTPSAVADPDYKEKERNYRQIIVNYDQISTCTEDMFPSDWEARLNEAIKKATGIYDVHWTHGYELAGGEKRKRRQRGLQATAGCPDWCIYMRQYCDCGCVTTCDEEEEEEDDDDEPAPAPSPAPAPAVESLDAVGSDNEAAGSDSAGDDGKEVDDADDENTSSSGAGDPGPSESSGASENESGSGGNDESSSSGSENVDEGDDNKDNDDKDNDEGTGDSDGESDSESGSTGDADSTGSTSNSDPGGTIVDGIQGWGAAVEESPAPTSSHSPTQSPNTDLVRRGDFRVLRLTVSQGELLLVDEEDKEEKAIQEQAESSYHEFVQDHNHQSARRTSSIRSNAAQYVRAERAAAKSLDMSLESVYVECIDLSKARVYLLS